MALLDFTNIIAKLFEDKKLVIGLFVDLTKTLDCIGHQILLHTVQFYGIRGTLFLNGFSVI